MFSQINCWAVANGSLSREEREEADSVFSTTQKEITEKINLQGRSIRITDVLSLLAPAENCLCQMLPLVGRRPSKRARINIVQMQMNRSLSRLPLSVQECKRMFWSFSYFKLRSVQEKAPRNLLVEEREQR